MNKEGKLSRKWGYIFASVGLVSLAVAIVAIIKDEYIIGTACAVVFGGQLVNMIQWIRQK